MPTVHRSKRQRPPSNAKPGSLRELLTGGDRRSIGRSNAALGLLRADRARVAELVKLVADPDWLVVMRATDLLEKLAHEHPSWVQRYRRLFIGPLTDHDSWEIRLQIARALPLLRWTPDERLKVLTILHQYVNDPKIFVRAWSLDGLARFCESDPSLRLLVRRLLRTFKQSNSPALRSRAINIEARLRRVKRG
jgi:HEAT repeat protein